MATVTEGNIFRPELPAEMYPEEAIVEEIEADENLDAVDGDTVKGEPFQIPTSPVKQDNPSDDCDDSMQVLIPCSPSKSREREFGNISPISELLDDDRDQDGELDNGSKTKTDGVNHTEEDDEGSGKITPEPPTRSSFPRISDGRSSPILAYSPSLIKSPSSNNSKPRVKSTSPSSGGSGGGKRPRNITRMLDNISDHSSGEDDVNHVEVMMSKFSV